MHNNVTSMLNTIKPTVLLLEKVKMNESIDNRECGNIYCCRVTTPMGERPPAAQTDNPPSPIKPAAGSFSSTLKLTQP